jgi:DNA-binding LacI/PurR family transcriptional regulator
LAARSLRTQKTQTIALLIADLSNGFYHRLARSVQDVARQHNYEVLISNSDHFYENEMHFCEIVLGRGVDGVAMIPQHLTAEDLDYYLTQTQIPFVALGQHIDHPRIDVVYVEDERATYETTSWLIGECGHKTLGFIGVPDFLPPGPRRLRGFTRALNDAGLAVEPRFMQQGNFSIESGKRAANALVEAGNVPSALVVINDSTAIGVILALQDAGYAVPDDVAVVGFDDIPEATIVRPALTTISQYPREIGHRLATALFERIENPDIVGRRMLECPYKRIERQSTRQTVPVLDTSALPSE